METKELIKKMLTESRNMLTEENILPIFAYLYSGGTLEDYPDKNELEVIKIRFKGLIS